MNKAQRQLNLFSYVLYEFLKVDAEFNRCSLQDALRSMTKIRVTKLLYLLCLESLSKEKPLGLFEFFGPFYAYGYGPVHCYIYYSLDIVPGFRYDYDKSWYDDVEEKNIPIPDSRIKELIDLSINSLKNRLGDKFTDQGKLVAICQNLWIWRNTICYKTNRQMSVDLFDLVIERSYYEREA